MTEMYSPTGWVAVFTDHSGNTVRRPVEQFDEEGTPMVVDHRAISPNLRSPDTVARLNGDLEAFHRIEPVHRLHSAIAATTGWRMRFKHDGAYFTRAIAAWLVNHDGTMIPAVGTHDTNLAPTTTGTILAPDDDDNTGLSPGAKWRTP